jgi:hypothetical protein
MGARQRSPQRNAKHVSYRNWAKPLRESAEKPFAGRPLLSGKQEKRIPRLQTGVAAARRHDMAQRLSARKAGRYRETVPQAVPVDVGISVKCWSE